MYDIISDSARLGLLQRQLDYAVGSSRFYADRLKNIRLESLEALASLPFTTREDICEHGREMLCVPAADIERIVSLRSSGTESAPKRLYFTRGDLERTVTFFGEGMGRICEPGDKTAILLPCTVPDGVGDLLYRGLINAGAVPVGIGAVRTPDECAALYRERPDVIVGMPWQVRLAAMTYPDMRVKKILLSADYLPSGMQSFIENIWHCTVLEHYGLTETGYGCAVETVRGDGMVLRCDELIAEVIDPETGKTLGDGEIGELVLTTLRREAMPLIRYRTGDCAVISDGGRRINRVYGRMSVPRSFYAAQDALCAIDWLYDYRDDSDVVTAYIRHDSPRDAEDILREICAKPVRAVRTDGSISPAYAEKRISSRP